MYCVVMKRTKRRQKKMQTNFPKEIVAEPRFIMKIIIVVKSILYIENISPQLRGVVTSCT